MKRREKAEKLQELFEQGYAIDYRDKYGKWNRCWAREPIRVYKCGESIRIAKEEQESEVIILEGAPRKYYTEEKE
jgi:hypothetical protein